MAYDGWARLRTDGCGRAARPVVEHELWHVQSVLVGASSSLLPTTFDGERTAFTSNAEGHYSARADDANLSLPEQPREAATEPDR
jgi:hypothetical protein